MTDIQEQARLVLDSLNKSVSEALDRKRRLGQYAVFWENGKIVRTEADDTPTEENTSEVACDTENTKVGSSKAAR